MILEMVCPFTPDVVQPEGSTQINKLTLKSWVVYVKYFKYITI